jgi:hypothetical protein
MPDNTVAHEENSPQTPNTRGPSQPIRRRQTVVREGTLVRGDSQLRSSRKQHERFQLRIGPQLAGGKDLLTSHSDPQSDLDPTHANV